MAGRLSWIAMGVVLAALALDRGADEAQADWSGGGLVAGVADGHHGTYAWNADGQAYFATLSGPNAVWQRAADVDLPVPAASVKSITGGGHGILVVTAASEVWWWYSGSWRPMPTLPGGPVAVQSESFGRTKANHR